MREADKKIVFAGTNSGRRRVLRFVLLGFAGIGASIFDRVLANEAPDSPDAWLTALLSDNRAAARLGADYLNQYPHEADAKLLSHLVRRSLSKGNFSPKSFSVLKSAIASTIRNEYRAGGIAQVEGWLLSRTEARLYALSSLRMTG